MVSNVYAVIGEHRCNPDQLLVVDPEGQWYCWQLDSDETMLLERDEETEQQWRLDPMANSGPLPPADVLFGM